MRPPPTNALEEMQLRIDEWQGNLNGWAEPDGYLVPTEPDPMERLRTRERLTTAIEVMQGAMAIVRAHTAPRESALVLN